MMLSWEIDALIEFRAAQAIAEASEAVKRATAEITASLGTPLEKQLVELNDAMRRINDGAYIYWLNNEFLNNI